MRRLTLLTNPDKCNLRCPLCFLNQRGKPFGMGEMPIEVAKAAIEKYAEGLSGKEPCGLREVIPSTMGEPLLYSKFGELLEYCSAREIPLNLTTNGTFPGIWGTAAGMERLLLACSDIKVSCMAFDEATFTEMVPGISFACWRGNVEKLLDVARSLNVARRLHPARSPQAGSAAARNIASVSLQVTLHRKLLRFAPEILRWAESVGVARVKWNLPVFISAGERLRGEYGIPGEAAREIRRELETLRALYPHVRCEGSLFFGAVSAGKEPCGLFRDEIWILPDGTEEFCPNPERRFGDCASAGATCEGCVLFT